MIKVSQGYLTEIENGHEATVNGAVAKAVRDEEGNLEIVTEGVVEDGAVTIVVKDGSDSTYVGTLKNGEYNG